MDLNESGSSRRLNSLQNDECCRKQHDGNDEGTWNDCERLVTVDIIIVILHYGDGPHVQCFGASSLLSFFREKRYRWHEFWFPHGNSRYFSLS